MCLFHANTFLCYLYVNQVTYLSVYLFIGFLSVYLFTGFLSVYLFIGFQIRTVYVFHIFLSVVCLCNILRFELSCCGHGAKFDL